MKLRITHVFILLSLTAAVACTFAVQTLDERLTQQTDFIPQPASPPDQLIEVGRKFQIPLAIEWLDEKEEVVTPSALFPPWLCGTVDRIHRTALTSAPTPG